MKPFVSLLLFAILVCATQAVQAADPGSRQPEPGPKPPLKVLKKKQNQGVQPFLSPSLHNQKHKDVEVEELRDIQGPVTLPEPKNPWIPVTIGALVLLLVGLIFFFRKRKKQSAPPLPAHEIALAELAKAKVWMNEGNGILYAQRLSEILRQYIESRFFIQSTRQTTGEFLTGLRSGSSATAAIRPHISDLQICLEQCDMAKFAHLTPDEQAMAEMETAVKHFIETTRPVQQAGGTT